MWRYFSLVTLGMCGASASAQPQGQLIDGMIAVVGSEVVLHSDLMAKMEQAKQAGATATDDVRCFQMEELLYQKLLLNQAKLDSVVVGEDQVKGELDRRIAFFVQQLGSEKKLEEFYGKSISRIKADFHDQIEEQLRIQSMQQNITSDVEVTPKHVERYFKQLPKDSLPFINAEVEYAQIEMAPKAPEDEERAVRKRLEEYRTAILAEEKDFCTLAILYSEDPGSAENCGELGMVPRGVMVSEFDAVAFSLKDGEISPVFKTEYGYHIMKMIERRGEQFNARHILIKPKVSSADLDFTRSVLDSLVKQIRSGDLTFAKAAGDNSQDGTSSGSDGVVVDPQSGGTRWDIGSLDAQTFFVVDKLKVGEVSDPSLMTGPDGTKKYRVIKIIAYSEPHKADLGTDYRLFHDAALDQARGNAIDEWLTSKLSSTYVRIADGLDKCKFDNSWGSSTAQ